MLAVVWKPLRLDRFGLAHAVVAIGDGMSAEAVTARLRALSRTDEVLAQLDRSISEKLTDIRMTRQQIDQSISPR